MKKFEFVCWIVIAAMVFTMAISGCGRQKEEAPQEEPETEAAADTKETAKEKEAVVETEMVALEPELPAQQFQGTPVPVEIPNLEKPGTKREKLMVPKGTENLAAGKEVTSSDNFPIIGELEMVVDGDKEGVEGSYVELGPGKQYVQIDLGQKCAIHAVLVWHYHASARAYHDVIVQIGNDPDFTGDVETIFNNDHDNSAGMGVGEDPAYIETNEGRLIDAGGVVGRYVRLYSNGNTANDMNHYVEVEVYGKLAE